MRIALSKNQTHGEKRQILKGPQPPSLRVGACSLVFKVQGRNVPTTFHDEETETNINEGIQNSSGHLLASPPCVINGEPARPAVRALQRLSRTDPCISPELSCLQKPR